jgi:hypothetical protein
MLSLDSAGLWIFFVENKWLCFNEDEGAVDFFSTLFLFPDLRFILEFDSEDWLVEVGGTVEAS